MTRTTTKGTPMLRVFEPNMGWREAIAVGRQVLRRRVSPGEKVAEFEAALARYLGFAHVVCCNSGTTALELAIRAVSTTSLVFVPTYTFLAAANAAASLGKDVVGIKIDKSLCMAQVNPSSSTIVFVSHNGQCWELLKSTQPMPHVIHDAAQSLGCDMPGTSVCRATTLSFSGPKIITTGQGGAVCTNDDDVAKTTRQWLDHGGGDWRKTKIHESVGGNYRMSDLAAALGLAQFQRLDELLAIRRQRLEWYRNYFGDRGGETPQRWTAIVRTSAAIQSQKLLVSAGYEALMPYRALHESIPYLDTTPDPEAVRAANQCLYLPVHWQVRERDVREICRLIRSVDLNAEMVW